MASHGAIPRHLGQGQPPLPDAALGDRHLRRRSRSSGMSGLTLPSQNVLADSHRRPRADDRLLLRHQRVRGAALLPAPGLQERQEVPVPRALPAARRARPSPGCSSRRSTSCGTRRTPRRARPGSASGRRSSSVVGLHPVAVSCVMFLAAAFVKRSRPFFAAEDRRDDRRHDVRLATMPSGRPARTTTAAGGRRTRPPEHARPSVQTEGGGRQATPRPASLRPARRSPP